MAEKSDDSTSPSPAALRKARLAEALRENLRRRKAQARVRRGSGAGDADEADPGREGGEA